jgi:hypothetical protein
MYPYINKELDNAVLRLSHRLCCSTIHVNWFLKKNFHTSENGKRRCYIQETWISIVT